MGPSLLRKKRQQAQFEEAPSPQIRHSLSLPDLTTPLLDPSSWEGLPPLASALPSVGDTTPRPRKVSLVRSPGSPIQFHRPFTPWQVVNPDRFEPIGVEEGGDFRTSKAKWGRESGYSHASDQAGAERAQWRKKGKGKGKATGRLNVLVVGGKGVGKTSYVELLLASLRDEQMSASSPVGSTPSSPTIPGPPVSLTSSTAPSLPTSARPATTRLMSQTLDVKSHAYGFNRLRLVDTPGLALESDAVSEKERERGVTGLLRLLEERFSVFMQEESRIVRKATRGDDDLVHLILYLIDARRVLRPTAPRPEVDWSCVGVFDGAQESSAPPEPLPEPRLDPVEIDVIRRLSTRSNVLPVLTFSDALSTEELDSVRTVVRRDLAQAGLEGEGFGVFGEEQEGDSPSDESTAETLNPDPRSPTPELTDASSDGETMVRMPYALFAPDQAGPPFVRPFPWGEANVLNPDHCDFAALRDAVLGTHIKVLRSTTREVLYEKYRTEMLLAKQKGRGRGEDVRRERLSA